MDAGEVGGEDELVAEVVHRLQQPQDEQVLEAVGLGAGAVAEERDLELEASGDPILGPGIGLARLATIIRKNYQLKGVREVEY